MRKRIARTCLLFIIFIMMCGMTVGCADDDKAKDLEPIEVDEQYEAMIQEEYDEAVRKEYENDGKKHDKATENNGLDDDKLKSKQNPEYKNEHKSKTIDEGDDVDSVIKHN